MSDHSDLIAELLWQAPRLEKALRVEPPLTLDESNLMRRAADALSSQSLSLSEAREEIERLRGERDHWKFGHDAFEHQHGEVLEALRPFIRPLRRGDPDDYPVNVFTVTAGDMRRARSALENSKPALADATNAPASPDLSSLRKGAEVAVKPVVWEKYWGGSNDDIPSWRASTPVGLTLDVDFAGERLEKHSDADPVRLAAKQAEAFAWYETRIRSALVSGSREEQS